MAPSCSAPISRSREPAMTIEAVPLSERPALLERIIAAAIQFRWAILAAVVLLCAIGAWSFQRPPIHAHPHTTNAPLPTPSEAAGLPPHAPTHHVTTPLTTTPTTLP